MAGLKPRRFRPYLALGNKDGGKVETAIGSLIADAMKAGLSTDISFVASRRVEAQGPSNRPREDIRFRYTGIDLLPG